MTKSVEVGQHLGVGVLWFCLQAHARRALDFLWEKRQRNSNLVGTTINIHSGEWVRRGEAESYTPTHPKHETNVVICRQISGKSSLNYDIVFVILSFFL